MTRELRAVQSTFEALQQAAALSDEQICTLFHKHSEALAYGPERLLGTFQAVSTMLGVPMTLDTFRDVVLAASSRLLSTNPSTLLRHVTFFCQLYILLPTVRHWIPCCQDSAHMRCV